MLRRALGVALVGLVSCSVFVDLDGLSSPVAADPDTAQADAGTPADAGAPPQDAETADAPDAPDAPGGVFEIPSCNAGAFCDDFERSSIKGAWDEAIQSNTVLSLDSSTSTSPTRSLKIQVPSASGDGAFGYLSKTFVGAPSKLARAAVAANLRIDAYTEREVHAVTIRFEGPPVSYVYFMFRDHQIFLAEQSGSTLLEHAFDRLPPTGWQPWMIMVDATVQPPVATARIGPASVKTALSVPIVHGDVIIHFGVPYAGPGTSGTAWADDVRAFASPQ